MMRPSSILSQAMVWALAFGLVSGAQGSGSDAKVEATGEAKSASTRQEIYRQQREEKQSRLEPERLSRWEKLILEYEKRPLLEKLTVKGYKGVRLAVGGMPPGSGFVFGTSSIHGRTNDRVTFLTKALYSTRGYSWLETRAEFRPRARWKTLTAYTRTRYTDFKSSQFFGIGPDSKGENRTSYRLQRRQLGGGVAYQPIPFLELGAEVDLLNFTPGPGSREPSLETVFDPEVAPGFLQGQEFFVYKGRISFQFLDDDYPSGGISAALQADRYAGRGAESPSFSRFAAEVRGQIPLGTRSRRLAFRARTTHDAPDEGFQVPLYLLETLGGATTLRGFAEDRFRDKNTLLMNLEYRWEVWSYADLALFGDAGKVFDRVADLDLSRLENSFGFGVLFHTPAGLQLRIDVARSNEGFRVHIGTGPRF